MTRHNCWTCGNSYDGWECPVCSRNRLVEEQSREAAKQHEEELEAMERAAAQQAEQAARLEELMERQREAIEEAAFAAERTAAEATKQHRETTANAWKLQAEAKSRRAHSLYQSGMFEEAYKLAVQSVEQDPGNLDGLWVVASALLSLHISNKARPYLEKQIQLLNLPEYRTSPELFVRVLQLLSTQKDFFLLDNMFLETLGKNIFYWQASEPQAIALADLLVQLELLVGAASVLKFLLRVHPRSQGTLHTALILLKKFISQSDRDAANNIVDLLTTRAQSLLIETYLYEMYFLLGRDGKTRIDAFVHQTTIDSRGAIEADITQIKGIANGGDLSRETVDCVMHALREKYTEWKSVIETQIRDEAVTSAKSLQVKTRGGWCGVLSFVVLTIVAVEYCFAHGFRPESTGPFFPFGVLLGSIIIGTLYGQYVKRLRIAQETGRRLAAAFSTENNRRAALELPSLTPPSRGARVHAFELAIYVGIVTVYIAGWFSLMTSHGRPATSTPRADAKQANKLSSTSAPNVAHKMATTAPVTGSTGTVEAARPAISSTMVAGEAPATRVAATPQPALAESELIGVVYGRTVQRQFVELERTTARMYTRTSTFRGMQIAGELEGQHSPVRFTSADQVTFLVRLPTSTDAQKFQLFGFGEGKDKRLVIFSKAAGGSPVGMIQVDVRNLGDDLYQLLPSSALEPGEYGFSPTDSNDSFCFGVGQP